jgi:hypothetical protein
MNSKTIPANHALLFPVGEMQGQTANAESNADFQEQSSLGMDRALGLQKASLAAAVRLQSEVIESYKSASWCTPELAEWLDGLAEAFATCMELQMNLFALMGTHVSSTIAGIPGMNPQLTAEALARSMDLAIGPRKKV